MSYGNEDSSTLLAAMADGIGDLVFLSPEWIDVARGVIEEETRRRAEQLSDVESYTLCAVAFNAPAYLHCGGKLSWHVQFSGANVTVNAGEIPSEECDMKLVGDHSLMSNLMRLQYSNRDPRLLEIARDRLIRVGRWESSGGVPEHIGLYALIKSVNDTMATRTMPRFVWMSPEWVSCARHIVSTRAASEKYRDGLLDVQYTFAEEFFNAPKYAFPDGQSGGFWVRCDQGAITVGSGALPAELQPADFQNRGEYVPVVAVGRTVNAAMTEEDQDSQKSYMRTVFRHDAENGEKPFIEQASPSGNPQMPPELARVMAVLHDELSKRSSGELPVDYEPDIREQWQDQPSFDREESYDPAWLKYDQFDIYGNPRL